MAHCFKNWIGPTVKHGWNVGVYGLHKFHAVKHECDAYFFQFLKDTTAYPMGRYSLHILLLKSSIGCILKMCHFRPLFLYFLLFNSVDSKQMLYIKVCQWLNSIHRPLVLEATALPTEPQPRLVYAKIDPTSRHRLDLNEWSIKLIVLLS